MKRDYPLTLFAWCFVILVAAFLPWGTVGTVYIPLFGRSIGIGLETTGWTGSISVLGMVIPNWIEVVIAASLAFIGWLRAKLVFVRPSLPFWLGFYGAFHAAVFIVEILFSVNRSAFGVGSFATLVAFVGILKVLRESRAQTVPDLVNSQPTALDSCSSASEFVYAPLQD